MSEFNEKVKRAVIQAIKEKREVDGLADLLKQVMYYELRDMVKELRGHKYPDVALEPYKGRVYYRKGWKNRELELNKALDELLLRYGKLPEPPIETKPDLNPPIENTVGETPKQPTELVVTTSESIKL